MTTLLQRMQEDMRLRNLAPSIKAQYIHHVSMFARYFVKSPERIAPEEISCVYGAPGRVYNCRICPFECSESEQWLRSSDAHKCGV